MKAFWEKFDLRKALVMLSTDVVDYLACDTLSLKSGERVVVGKMSVCRDNSENLI